MKKSVLFLMVFAGLSHGCYGEDSVDNSGSRDISGYSSSFEMHTNEDGSIAFDEKRTQFDGEKGHTNRRYGRMEFDEHGRAHVKDEKNDSYDFPVRRGNPVVYRGEQGRRPEGMVSCPKFENRNLNHEEHHFAKRRAHLQKLMNNFQRAYEEVMEAFSEEMYQQPRFRGHAVKQFNPHCNNGFDGRREDCARNMRRDDSTSQSAPIHKDSWGSPIGRFMHNLRHERPESKEPAEVHEKRLGGLLRDFFHF